jgi:serine/threonine protein kinase
MEKEKNWSQDYVDGLAVSPNGQSIILKVLQEEEGERTEGEEAKKAPQEPKNPGEAVLIGEGGFGAVWKFLDPDGNPLVLKVCNPYERLAFDSQIIPNRRRILGILEEANEPIPDGFVFLEESTNKAGRHVVMPYFEGMDLKEKYQVIAGIQKEMAEKLSTGSSEHLPERIDQLVAFINLFLLHMRLVEQDALASLAALAEYERLSIFHQDVKPRNTIVKLEAEEGETLLKPKAILIDTDLALPYSGSNEAEDPIHPKDDVFALGVAIWNILNPQEKSDVSKPTFSISKMQDGTWIQSHEEHLQDLIEELKCYEMGDMSERKRTPYALEELEQQVSSALSRVGILLDLALQAIKTHRKERPSASMALKQCKLLLDQLKVSPPGTRLSLGQFAPYQMRMNVLKGKLLSLIT